MRVCIFEDCPDRFEPLCLTRPIFELRCGITSLFAKQIRHVGATSVGVLIRPILEEIYRQQTPGVRVNDLAWMNGGELLLINGRWLPPEDAFAPPASSCVGMAGGQVAYVWLSRDGEAIAEPKAPCGPRVHGSAGASPSRTSPSRIGHAPISFDSLPEWLADCRHALPTRDAGGRLLDYPWQLIDANADEIRRDFGWLKPNKETWERRGLTVNGPMGNLWIAPSAQIEPMVLADTRSGSVVIDEEAVISAFTRLEGPCYVGPRSHVLAAKIRAGTSIGPNCRIGGEVEASIIHGYTNKYHDGFLGHSYVGAWVNLGAGTHNSDLRNDYGEVSVVLRGISVPTGLNKVGCFVGDHTKTGLGTLLNTGSNIGAFCNLLPAGRYAPKYMPSFTSWNGRLSESSGLDALLATAELAMARRGLTLTPAHRALYAAVLAESQAERRRALRDYEQRQLRKSA